MGFRFNFLGWFISVGFTDCELGFGSTGRGLCLRPHVLLRNPNFPIKFSLSIFLLPLFSLDLTFQLPSDTTPLLIPSVLMSYVPSKGSNKWRHFAFIFVVLYIDSIWWLTSISFAAFSIDAIRTLKHILYGSHRFIRRCR